MQLPADTVKKPAFALAFLLLLTGLAYAGSLRGPFQYDDHNVIVSFAPVHSLAAWWDSMPGLRPLLKFSYALNWQLAPAPWAFHFFNLTLHLLNTALLLCWLRRVLPDSRAALMAALIFALHPAQTEAVTYISGRSVSLTALFCLLALYAQAVAQRHAGLLMALCTALALLVRETAWVLPFFLLLMEWQAGRAPREVAARLWPTFLVLLLGAAFFLLEPHYRRLLEFGVGIRPLQEQLLSQWAALRYFLTGPLLGLTPNLDPVITPITALTSAIALQLLLFFSGILLCAYGVWRRNWYAAGLLWFLLALLPTNSVFARLDLASDRHLYIALIGPAWAVGLWLARLRFGPVLAAALVLVLCVATLIRNEDYQSEYALWARTTQQSPQKARVWNNLGMACREAGNTDCARTAFIEALRRDPEHVQARLNLYFLDRAAP